MSWLVRLYPRRWRERYGDELEQLIRDLAPSGPRLRIVFDLVRGALDAHRREGLAMNQVQRRAAGRAALIVAAVWVALSVEIYLSNVAFPSPTDDDAIPVLLSYLCVFAALFLVGLALGRAGAGSRALVLAGLLAGVAIGLLTTGTFALVDNVWLNVVARQPTKIDGFLHSGASSMRAFVNHELVGVAVFLPVALGLVGAVLALTGGLAARGTPTRTR